MAIAAARGTWHGAQPAARTPRAAAAEAPRPVFSGAHPKSWMVQMHGVAAQPSAVPCVVVAGRERLYFPVRRVLSAAVGVACVTSNAIGASPPSGLSRGCRCSSPLLRRRRC